MPGIGSYPVAPVLSLASRAIVYGISSSVCEMLCKCFCYPLLSWNSIPRVVLHGTAVGWLTGPDRGPNDSSDGPSVKGRTADLFRAPASIPFKQAVDQ